MSPTVTPACVLSLMTSAVESTLADTSGCGEDEGALLSADEGEEMEHDGFPKESPLLSSLSSLLLQLSGSNAVSALNLIVGCVVLCQEKGIAEEEEEEDGEINPLAIAKVNLLKATKALMVIYRMYHKLAYFILCTHKERYRNFFILTKCFI